MPSSSTAPTPGAAPAAIETSPVFLIVVGERGRPAYPGGPNHNVGGLFHIAAHQHVRDIKSRAFPGVPDPKGAKIVGPIEVNRVTKLNDLLGKYGNIKYLAYFGHSWGYGETTEYGALYLGDENASDTNLSNGVHKNNTSVTALVNLSQNMTSGQIRLFGCQGGYTGPAITALRAVPPAEQLAKIVRPEVEVYAFTDEGGSAFTPLPEIGYLGKPYLGRGRTKEILKAEQAEVAKLREGAVQTKLWLVPNGMTAHMQAWPGEWDGKPYWKTP